jgi:hypothetical protein
MKSAVKTRWVKPSESLRKVVNPISKTPAKNNANHGLIKLSSQD